MDIDITSFFENDDAALYSASVAELGQNAGRITWRAAMARAEIPPPMLDSNDAIAAFRDHMRGYGAWEDSEIDEWTTQKCEALFIQLISGDIRECGIDTECPDWTEYERGAEEGQYSGRMYRGDDGRIWYYLGD